MDFKAPLLGHVLHGVMYYGSLNVALQILGRKFYKNARNHPCTLQEKLEIYYGPGRHRRETWSIFTLAARSFANQKYTDEASNIASDEDITENNYMFVMLSNLRVISHLIFPQ